MPSISSLKQGQRMQVNSPVPIGGEREARARGEDIAQLGNAVFNAGLEVKKYEMYKQGISDRNDEQSARNDLQKANQDIANEISTNMVGTDGRQAVPEYDRRFKEATDSIMEKYKGSSAKVRSAINAMAGQVSIPTRGDLYTSAQKQFTKYSIDKTEGNKNSLLANVRANPMAFESELQNFDQYLSTQVQNQLLTPGMKDQMMNVTKKEAAQMAVRSYIDSKQFDQAREGVKAYGAMFDLKMQNDLMDDIDKAAIQHLNRQATEADRRDREEERARKESHRANFGALYGSMSDLQTREQRDAFEARVDKQIANDEISPADGNYLKAQLRSDVNVQDDDLSYKYASRITSGENPAAIEKDIKQSVVDGRLSTKRGEQLLKSAMAHARNENANPALRAKMKRSNELMDAAFGKDMMDRLMPGESAQFKAEALAHRDELIQNGMDPDKATREAINTYLPGIKALPYAPGVDYKMQNDLTGLDQAAKIIAERYKDNKSDPKYIESLRKIKARRDAIIREEQINSSVMPKTQGNE